VWFPHHASDTLSIVKVSSSPLQHGWPATIDGRHRPSSIYRGIDGIVSSAGTPTWFRAGGQWVAATTRKPELS
jgi:hypothetical protein